MKYLLLLLLSLIALSFQTALDDYVNMPDPTYKYSLNSTINGANYVAYVIRLTSQTWLTAADTDRPVWDHWLTICVPHTPENVDSALLYVDGGSSNDNAPKTIDTLTAVMCNKMHLISCHIGQIPNQPITFKGDWKNKRRNEDAIIAYTWSHFLNDTAHPYWLLRLPMTKAVVKAMDTIVDFTSKLPGNVPKITSFGLSGGSKRGWTVWTVAAVDKRVRGIVPIVIPILNMVPTINRMFRVYGKWSFALDDYVEEGVLKFLNKPEFQKLADVEDPFTYNSRLATIPKYVVAACGDEFFLPDSTRDFWNQLIGYKYLRMVPNAEHSLAPQDIDLVVSIGTWFHMQFTKHNQPKFEYQIIRSNSTGAKIILHSEDKPTAVYMWYASTLSVRDRDFRMFTCPSQSCFNPVIWFYTQLFDHGNGTYIAEMNAPMYGWNGFLVEAIYVQSYNPVFPEATLKYTSEVNVVPDILPYPPCKDPDC